MTQSKFSVTVLAEAAVFIALAVVIDFIKLYQLPNGGTVSLVMLPLLILAIRRGLMIGVLAGAVYGIIDFLLKPYFLNVVQFFFDYIFAFGAFGIAGIVAASFQTAIKNNNKKAMAILVLIASSLGMFGRFVGSFISGVAFYGEYAPKGQSPWLYSLLVNGGFFLVLFVLTTPVALIIAWLQPRIFNINR